MCTDDLRNSLEVYTAVSQALLGAAGDGGALPLSLLPFFYDFSFLFCHLVDFARGAAPPPLRQPRGPITACTALWPWLQADPARCPGWGHNRQRGVFKLQASLFFTVNPAVSSPPGISADTSQLHFVSKEQRRSSLPNEIRPFHFTKLRAQMDWWLWNGGGGRGQPVMVLIGQNVTPLSRKSLITTKHLFYTPAMKNVIITCHFIFEHCSCLSFCHTAVVVFLWSVLQANHICTEFSHSRHPTYFFLLKKNGSKSIWIPQPVSRIPGNGGCGEAAAPGGSGK